MNLGVTERHIYKVFKGNPAKMLQHPCRQPRPPMLILSSLPTHPPRYIPTRPPTLIQPLTHTFPPVYYMAVKIVRLAPDFRTAWKWTFKSDWMWIGQSVVSLLKVNGVYLGLLHPSATVKNDLLLNWEWRAYIVIFYFTPIFTPWTHTPREVL